jgi:cysteine desulfurase
MIHTDAVQAIGNVRIDVKKSNISLLSLSAHKFYGPKGIGVLYIKNGVKISNRFYGGSQERDRRPGTLNTPLIVGLKNAIIKADENLEINNEVLLKRAQKVKEIVLNAIPDALFNGHPEYRIKGNLSFSFLGLQSEGLLVLLDTYGVMVSAGAACSAGAVTVSHVIKAINENAENYGTIRISLSHLTTDSEAEAIGNAIVKAVQNLRNR